MHWCEWCPLSFNTQWLGQWATSHGVVVFRSSNALRWIRIVLPYKCIEKIEVLQSYKFTKAKIQNLCTYRYKHEESCLSLSFIPTKESLLSLYFLLMYFYKEVTKSSLQKRSWQAVKFQKLASLCCPHSKYRQTTLTSKIMKKPILWWGWTKSCLMFFLNKLSSIFDFLCASICSGHFMAWLFH